MAKGAVAKGGRGKGGGKGRGGGLAGLAAQATRAQIAAAEAPIQEQIKAEKAANLQRAQQQMGFAKAAAAIMQQAAPAIGNAYANAANSDAGYARALGTAVQAPITQSVDQNNAFLTKMGTPTGGLGTAAPVGDVSYGLEGYIPATSLQREGAAWESQAQLAPGNLLHAGQQQAAETLGNDPTLASLQGDLAKLAATQPEVYQKLLSAYQSERDKQIGLRQSQQRIGIESFRAQTSAQQGQERIGIAQQNANTSAERAAQTAFNENRNYKIALKRLGIAQRKEQISALASQAKLNSGGFTPDELTHIKNTAANMAVALFNGTKGDSTHPPSPKANYRFAMKYMITHGIPPTIADHELRAAGYRKGDGRGTPPEPLRLQGVGGAPLGAGGDSVAAQKIVGLAHQYLGTPYVYGGESPKGFDCSGFAQFLYAQAGIHIPRTSETQWESGSKVGKNQLQPGDLVFFKGSDSVGGLPGHVGVYIGDGMMIDAPHTGARVRVESVYGFPGYMGARRYGRG